MFKIKRLGILEKVRTANMSNKPREKLSPDFRIKLVKYFESDVKKLSDILEIDLSHWK